MSNKKNEGKNILEHPIIIVENLETGELSLKAKLKYHGENFQHLTQGQNLAMAVQWAIRDPEAISYIMNGFRQEVINSKVEVEETQQEQG